MLLSMLLGTVFTIFSGMFFYGLGSEMADSSVEIKIPEKFRESPLVSLDIDFSKPTP